MNQQPMNEQPVNFNAVNANNMIRCKVPSPNDGGYSDIILDPQNFVVLPPQKEKGFFGKVFSSASKAINKASKKTKNFVENRKDVICIYCTSYQSIDNDKKNYYCSNCKYLNNQIQKPIRKAIFCGQCDSKQKVDLGTTWCTTCSQCSRVNIIPTLKPMAQIPNGHPCLINPQYAQYGQQVQSAQNGQQVQSDQYCQQDQSAQNVQQVQYAQNGQQIQSALPCQQAQSAQYAQQVQYVQNGQQIQSVQLGQYVQSAQYQQQMSSAQNGQQISTGQKFQQNWDKFNNNKVIKVLDVVGRAVNS